MRSVGNDTIADLLELSRLLGEFGRIKRATLLPGGEPETDSHHSFALALMAYELACQYAPELDTRKILLYSLVHDLSELVTGDVVTLLASDDELEQKAAADEQAIAETEQKFAVAPHIMAALKAYEAKEDDEALFVYWVDKLTTIPTHFYDNGTNLRNLGIKNKNDIRQWYERTIAKLQKQQRQPHLSAVAAFELAYQRMRDEVVDVT